MGRDGVEWDRAVMIIPFDWELALSTQERERRGD
jgi:hypothetical protein